MDITKTDLQKTNQWLPVGKGRVRGKIQVGEIKRYKLLCIKQISNKGILHSTGKYSHYFVITEKKKKGKIHQNIKGKISLRFCLLFFLSVLKNNTKKKRIKKFIIEKEAYHHVEHSGTWGPKRGCP